MTSGDEPASETFSGNDLAAVLNALHAAALRRVVDQDTSERARELLRWLALRYGAYQPPASP